MQETAGQPCDYVVNSGTIMGQVVDMIDSQQPATKTSGIKEVLVRIKSDINFMLLSLHFFFFWLRIGPEITQR